MAVIQKTLFAKNLDRYSVLVNDTDPNSKYFKVTELPDTLTGGKNAFLIAGSDLLVADTKILIEIKSSDGSIIYNEPGEGLISSSLNGETFVTEYYEGVSKVVAIYVYPDTNFGESTITILGEVNQYEDGNGLLTPIPLDWEGKYNVKWQKTINVNPSLANTTKIRFFERPTANITEILSPIYRIVSGSKVESAVTQSFANIKLSNLETFAGDVKRVKVFRTSIGDISDYDLIQDILVESKELLTSTGSFFTGSVVGNTGTFTAEVLKNQWNSGSLNTTLNSTRVEAGVRLTGSGLFTYTQSLDLKSTNTYELNLDAFYSSSTNSNLGIYLSQFTTSGDGITPTIVSSSIATLIGTQPTKNLLDTTIPFTIDRNYPTASLYFSQSQGEWHLGNVSLKLSQDTAFSPDEISFITTMPTVLGNETFNFKFEFYDVNNNYVPVAVTQSALFTGGNNNINGTLTLISSSASGSLADLNRVSSSISGTIVITSGSVNTLSGSVSGSITTLSSSVSGSITTLSGSVSRSVALTLSSSLSTIKLLADGGYPGTFIESSSIYSPNIAGINGYFSELFKVGKSPNSIYLDARPGAPRKIFIGGAIPSGLTEYSGAYNNTNTPVYLDSTGQFSLGNKLSFDSSGNLSVNGSITVGAGSNAATDANALLYATRAATSASVSASAAQSAANATALAYASASVNSLAAGDWIGGGTTFISAKSIYSPVIQADGGYIAGLFKVGNNGITLDGINKKIYVGTGTYGNANTPFYFASGSTNIFSLGNKLTWDGNTLSITGNVTIGSTALTEANTLNANTTATNVGLGNVSNLTPQNQAQTGLIAGTTITGGGITLSNGGNIKGGQTDFNTGTGFFLGYSSGYKFSIGNSSDNYLTWNGITLNVGGIITATSGEIGGWTIGGNKIYKANKLELDASAVYPAINVYGSDNIPRVIINNSPALSSLSGGGAGSGTYDATSKTSANTNTQYFYDTIDFPTVAGANYTLTITFTESDSAYACNFSPVQASGQLTWKIDIYNTAVTSVLQNIYFDGSQIITNQTFWTYSDLGGINGVQVVANVVGDGTTYKIRPSTYYSGTAAAARDLDFPNFNYSWAQSVSKTEIIPGGFQVVNTSAAYLIADRVVSDSPSTPWMISAGNWKHNGTLITTSDRNIKKNITPINFDLTKLNEIDGYSYDKTIDYDGDGNGDVVIPTYGIIAQEIETILPNAVTTNASDGIKGVDYNAVTGMLLSAVKKLYLKVVELENRISGSI